MSMETIGLFIKHRFQISTEIAFQKAYDKESYRRAIVTDFIQRLYRCITADDIDEHVVSHVLDVLNFCLKEQKLYNFASTSDMEKRMREELPEEVYKYIKERYDSMSVNLFHPKTDMQKDTGDNVSAPEQAPKQTPEQAPKPEPKKRGRPRKVAETAKEEQKPKPKPRVKISKKIEPKAETSLP